MGLMLRFLIKKKCLDFGLIGLDNSSPYAKDIKAVNTIVRKEKVLKGFNTDVAGFLRHLNKVNF